MADSSEAMTARKANHRRVAFYDAWAPSFDRQQTSLKFLEEPCVLGVLGKLGGKRAIDLGCGTGRYISTLLARYEQVEAVDFSARMLAEARAKFAHVRAERLTFRQRALEQLRLRKRRYDLVLSTMVLSGIEARTAVLRKCAAATAVGGHLVLSTYHPMQALKHRRITGRIEGGAAEIHAPFVNLWMVSDYLRVLQHCGLRVRSIEEPLIDGRFARRLPKHAGEVGWPHVLVIHASRPMTRERRGRKFARSAGMP